jgi:hypothetical protein
MGPFGPSEWFYLMVGGAGAIWFGLVGIIEMFALVAEAGP